MIANICTVNSLTDGCKHTLRQCPEGWVSHQKDLLIVFASLESFDMFCFSSGMLTCVPAKL